MSIFFKIPNPFRGKGGAATTALTREQMTDLVDLEMAARSLRMSLFDPAVINEQSWIVMQELFQAHLEKRKPRSKSIVADEEVMSPTTLLRYIDHLEKFDIVKRTSDPADNRVKLVELTESAIFWMEEYYAFLLQRSRPKFSKLGAADGH